MDDTSIDRAVDASVPDTRKDRDGVRETSESNADPVRRPRKACTNCRAQKVRCLPEDDSIHSTSQCKRCNRLGLACEYATRKRGRLSHVHPLDDPMLSISHSAYSREKSPSLLFRHNAQPGPSAPPLYYATAPTQPRFFSQDQEIADDILPAHLDIRARDTTSHTRADGSRTDVSRRPTPTPRPETVHPIANNFLSGPVPSTSTPVSRMPRQQHLQSAQRPTHPLDHSEAFISDRDRDRESRPTSRGMDIRESPPRNRMASPSSTLAGTGGVLGIGRHDMPVLVGPVDLGILAEPEAKYLFRQFSKHMMPVFLLFDPKWHTYERVQQSTTLFTAVLYVTARFFRPDLADSLLELADTLINRQTNRGIIDVPIIQAMLVLIHWKRVHDRSALLKLGLVMAGIRQLSLAKPKATGEQVFINSPEGEQKMRSRLNEQRTVLVATTMDFSYGQMYRLVTPASQIDVGFSSLWAWAESHRHLDVGGDFCLSFCSSVPWTIQEPPAMYWNTSTDENSDPIDAALLASEKKMVRHLQTTLQDPAMTASLRPMTSCVGHVVILNVVFQRVLNSPTAENKASLLGYIDELREDLAEAANEGYLRYWSDHSCSLICQPGIILFKIRRHLELREVIRVLWLFDQFGQICSSASEYTADHPMSFIKRSYLRLSNVFEQLKQDLENGRVNDEHNSWFDTEWPGFVSLDHTRVSGIPVDLEWMWNGAWTFSIPSNP